MESLEYVKRKYYKYKYKYKILKQFGGHPDSVFINIKTIYLKFITENIVSYSTEDVLFDEKHTVDDPKDALSQRLPKASKKSSRITLVPKYLDAYYLNLTPEILGTMTHDDKLIMENEFKLDDDTIANLQLINDERDLDYVRYENFGKPIECWIADNMLCPCCNLKTLRRYANVSMPIIDLVCINHEHTIKNGVKFFQVKTSNGNLFNELPYFNYDETNADVNANTIHVGSVRWGKTVHEITPNNTEFEKRILCGYICIQFNDKYDKIIFNFKKSFIVLPQYLIRTNVRKNLFGSDAGLMMASALVHADGSEIHADGGPTTSIVDVPAISIVDVPAELSEDDKWYYKYIESLPKHPRIKFNLKTNKILNMLGLIPSTEFTLPPIEKLSFSVQNPLNVYEIK